MKWLKLSLFLVDWFGIMLCLLALLIIQILCRAAYETYPHRSIQEALLYNNNLADFLMERMDKRMDDFR